jgi:hypothetical protein
MRLQLRQEGSTPAHRDEMKFLPLQAADLYVGIKRHQAETSGRDARCPAVAAAPQVPLWRVRFSTDT